MKIVALILTALLFAGAAHSDSYRHVVRHTPHGPAYGPVRVVAHQNLVVVTKRPNHVRQRLVYRTHRPVYRRVAVVAYRPHTVYPRHFHRHDRRCHH